MTNEQQHICLRNIQRVFGACGACLQFFDVVQNSCVPFDAHILYDSDVFQRFE